MKPDAASADQKRLLDLAVRLKLDDEQRDQKIAWVLAEAKDRRAKLKEETAAALKTILTFAEKETGGSGIGALANDLLKLDPNDAQAHTILGHFKDGDKWVDPWEAIVARGGLKDVKVRYAIHKQLAESRKEQTRFYPDYKIGLQRDAASGMGAKAVIYRSKIVGHGPGEGTQFIWAPGKYVSTRSWPLIVYLHGGGAGGLEASLRTASNNLGAYPVYFPDAEYVIVAPAARNHVKNSWNVKENMLDVVDAIIDACNRFNIDRKRIYLTGTSMGGQGTQRFSWVVPELFAAFSPQAGAYWNDFPVPDLTGKPFFVVHGAKDEKFRNDTLTVFLEKLKAANAEVDYLNLPDAGHNLPNEPVIPRMLTFFKKYTNDFAPDLKLVRRVIEETVKEAPMP